MEIIFLTFFLQNVNKDFPLKTNLKMSRKEEARTSIKPADIVKEEYEVQLHGYTIRSFMNESKLCLKFARNFNLKKINFRLRIREEKSDQGDQEVRGDSDNSRGQSITTVLSEDLINHFRGFQESF